MRQEGAAETRARVGRVATTKGCLVRWDCSSASTIEITIRGAPGDSRPFAACQCRGKKVGWPAVADSDKRKKTNRQETLDLTKDHRPHACPSLPSPHCTCPQEPGQVRCFARPLCHVGHSAFGPAAWTEILVVRHAAKEWNQARLPGCLCLPGSPRL